MTSKINPREVEIEEKYQSGRKGFEIPNDDEVIT
jgi:hypothetical protein